MRGSNIPPTAISDVVGLSTYMGVPLNIDVLANDYDVDNFPGLPLKIYSYDTLSFDGSPVKSILDDTKMTYTPKLSYFGIDTFDYKITDGLAASNTASVKLSVICKPPIITPKTLSLRSNTTYTLDITNPASSSDIIFQKGLPDRDENIPPQSVSIIPGSIKSSGNITILLSSATTIQFRTGVLGASVGVGTFLEYNIRNSICKYDKNGLNTGITKDPSVVVTTLFLGDVQAERAVPFAYRQYRMFDRTTKDYPWDVGGWFVFCFDSWTVPDKFYVTCVSRPYKNASGVTVIDETYYGEIGLIGTRARFLFYKPKGSNLDIWGATNSSGSYFDVGCVQVVRPSLPPSDPNYIFPDLATPPTNAEVLACLAATPRAPGDSRNIYQSNNDITASYPGRARPPFMVSVI